MIDNEIADCYSLTQAISKRVVRDLNHATDLIKDSALREEFRSRVEFYNRFFADTRYYRHELMERVSELEEQIEALKRGDRF